MPASCSNCDHLFINDLVNIIKPASCFDVGCGYGKTGYLVKSQMPNTHITGFEVYPKYIDDQKDNLSKVYDEIIINDFYLWIQNNVDWQVDLIVFGDVLEHFMKSKVFDILDMCSYRAKWIVIKVPLNYLQNTYDNNINEAHLSTIKLHELALSYNIVHYAQVGIIHYYLIKGLLT